MNQRSATYLRIIRADWTVTTAMFSRRSITPTAIEDHGVFNGSAAEYVDWMAGRNVEGSHWMHNNTTQVIEIDGDVAHTETYCLAFKRQAEPDPQGRSREWLVRVRYLDRVERRDGVWKIAHRRVVYAPNGVLPLDDAPATPESVVEAGKGTDEFCGWSA